MSRNRSLVVPDCRYSTFLESSVKIFPLALVPLPLLVGVDIPSFFSNLFRRSCKSHIGAFEGSSKFEDNGGPWF